MESFLLICGEMLGRLLEDYDLFGQNEEEVREAVTEWSVVEGQALWHGLVGKIRFPLIGSCPSTCRGGW
jgi:hypothetical protein